MRRIHMLLRTFLSTLDLTMNLSYRIKFEAEREPHWLLHEM